VLLLCVCCAASGPFQLQNRMKSYAVWLAYKWVSNWLLMDGWQTLAVIRTDRICLGIVDNQLKSPVCDMADSNQTIRFLDVPDDPQGRFHGPQWALLGASA